MTLDAFGIGLVAFALIIGAAGWGIAAYHTSKTSHHGQFSACMTLATILAVSSIVMFTLGFQERTRMDTAQRTEIGG